MASKSYGWDVRNIAKISPKMAKKQPFLDFFSIFSQTVLTIRTKASQKEKDLSRLLYRICGSGFIFSKTVQTILTNFSTVILHHIRVLYVQWRQNRMARM